MFTLANFKGKRSRMGNCIIMLGFKSDMNE
jgi:hypothetical protein